jgi:fructokinase
MDAVTVITGGFLMRATSPCIFGEVLVDCFPTGERVLGGAPFNVAWHLQAFGEAPRFISRVGNDREGNAILDGMLKWGMRTDGVQIDEGLPTGRVDVTFEDGEPAYDIVHPSAYDAIVPDASDGQYSMIYHGSLALRDAASSHALLDLKKRSATSAFVDVNLRAPWWRKEQIAQLLEDADWVKLNADELGLLASATSSAEDFIAEYRLKGLILTNGSKGAEVVTPGGESVRVVPAKNLNVVDTVGAGDAFASVMLLGLLRNWSLQLTAERAQDFASRMVSQRGATVHDPYFYDEIMATWQVDGRQELADV